MRFFLGYTHGQQLGHWYNLMTPGIAMFMVFSVACYLEVCDVMNIH